MLLIINSRVVNGLGGVSAKEVFLHIKERGLLNDRRIA